MNTNATNLAPPRSRLALALTLIALAASAAGSAYTAAPEPRKAGALGLSP